MALSKTGLSDLIYDNINGTFKTPKKGRPSLRKLADALADAIVTHIKENATVNVNVTVDTVNTTTNVTTSTSGLQRDPVTPFAATLAPLATVPLTGTGTGSGTGTGTIS